MGARRVLGGRRAVVIIAAIVLVLVAAACDPISHPTFTTVEPGNGPVRLVDLSADGAYAFVQATGAGATVPGAGLWRVDRADGTAVQLPDPVNLVRISRDGHRALYKGTGFAQSIWQDGATVAVPNLTKLSADLRWGVFVNPFTGHVHRWSLATGTHADIEVGFPRPAGFDGVEGGSTFGISNDGNVIWIPMRNAVATCQTRFIDLNLGVAHDFPYCGLSVIPAPGTGASHLFIPARSLDPPDPILTFGGPSHLELVSSSTGEVQRTLDAGSGNWFDGMKISDNGWVVWAIESTATLVGAGPPCGTPTTPPCGTLTVSALEAVAATPSALVRLPLDPRLSTGVQVESARFTITSDGRWLTYATGQPDDPVHVLDRLNGNDEELVGHAGIGKVSPEMTDGGAVVAYPETGGGWFEHEVAPPSS